MKNLFLWEIRKNAKKGAIIGVGVAAIVMLILIAVVYNLLYDILQDSMSAVENLGMEESGYGEGMGMSAEQTEESYYLSEEKVDGMITALTDELKEAEKEYAEEKNATGYAEIFRIKTMLATVKYAKTHGLYNQDVRLYGINYDVPMGAENFIETYIAVLSLIIAVYGIVLAANSNPSEYKSGTIKLLMTRPIAKTSLLTAKLLAIYAMLAVAFFVPVLIAYVYGAIAFGTDATVSVVCGFNAMTANVTTVGALTFGIIMERYIFVVVLATISFCLATLTRNSTAGLIPPLVIMLSVGGLLNSLGITAFLLSNALSFSSYFGVTNVSYHGNFFLSLGIVVFWTAASLIGTFLVTKKRDVC